MTINVINAVKPVTFKDIKQGEFFSSLSGEKVYLKIDEDIDHDDVFNAVSMEKGFLVWFADNENVYALDVEMKATFKTHNFTVEY